MPEVLLGSVGEARLRDGRRITFCAAGPRRGFPVLYMHGAIGSPRWRTPQLDSLIEHMGVRYVVLNRPGFSGSTPDPGRSVADFAADVEQVVDALGLERFSVIGVSAGAPYALACAAALGERVRAVAAASPLTGAEGAGALGALRYKLPWIPFGAPALGPLAADVALRALSVRSATPPSAMIDDYAACMRPWGFELADVGGRVFVWHGARDVLVPRRHALRLARLLPGCETVVEPGAGHFFYSRRLAEIVSPLVEPQPRFRAAA